MSNFWGAYQKVLRTYKFKYAYLPKCLRVLTETSTRTHENEYYVLTTMI